jgi:hypothetical protein
LTSFLKKKIPLRQRKKVGTMLMAELIRAGIKVKTTLRMGLWISMDDQPSRRRPEAGGHPGLYTVSL